MGVLLVCAETGPKGVGLLLSNFFSLQFQVVFLRAEARGGAVFAHESPRRTAMAPRESRPWGQDPGRGLLPAIAPAPP